MNGFADKIHPYAGTDRCNIERSQKSDHILQCREHILFCNDYFCMLTSDVICHLFCVFQIDGIFLHPNCKCTDRSFTLSRCHCAHKRRIQPSGEKKSDFRICHQPLFDPGHQFLPNIGTHLLQIILTDLIHLCNIAVADKFSVFIIMPRRKRTDFFTQPDQIFGFTCKYDDSLLIISIIERADTDRISCRNISLCFSVIDDAGKLRIQHTKHFCAICLIERQKHFAVRITLKRISVGKAFSQTLKSENLSIAYHITATQ